MAIPWVLFVVPCLTLISIQTGATSSFVTNDVFSNTLERYDKQLQDMNSKIIFHERERERMEHECESNRLTLRTYERELSLMRQQNSELSHFLMDFFPKEVDVFSEEFNNSHSFNANRMSTGYSEKYAKTLRKRQLTGPPVGVYSFHAVLGTKRTGLINRDIVVFDYEASDLSNAYEHTTGKFSCPIAGTYVFTWVITGEPGQVLDTQLRRNGNWLGSINSDSPSGVYGSASGTVNVHLAVGDKVWVQVHDPNGGHHFNIYPEYSSFSGFLIP